MILLGILALREKPKDEPVTFPPTLRIELFERPYNHEQDKRFESGPNFLEIISIKEPGESELAFSFDEDETDYFKMFMPESSVNDFAQKGYVVITPTEYDSAFKKKEHFTRKSERYEIAINPMDLINFFKRVLYGVRFQEYAESQQVVLERIENEVPDTLYGHYGDEEDMKLLKELALEWFHGNMEELKNDE